MGRFFDMDSPLMRFLSRVCDLMLLNLLTMLCCLPIVTVGASLSAMYYVELKWVRKEEGYILKPFLREFRSNLKQGIAEWLLILAVAVVLALDLYLFQQAPDEFPEFMRYIVVAVAVFLYLAAQWIFLLQSHFFSSVGNTVKNAFILAIARFPRTLGMALTWIAAILLMYLSVTTELMVIFPLTFLFFFSLPGFICCKLASTPFAAFEPEKEEMAEQSSEEDKEEAYRILKEESAVRHDEQAQD